MGASAPELGDNASLHSLLIGRREQRQGVRLVLEAGSAGGPTHENEGKLDGCNLDYLAIIAELLDFCQQLFPAFNGFIAARS